jgi:hypothetical protein
MVVSRRRQFKEHLFSAKDFVYCIPSERCAYDLGYLYSHESTGLHYIQMYFEIPNLHGVALLVNP